MARHLDVPSGHLTRLPLSPPSARTDDVEYVDGVVVFRSEGWYEILLEVDWAPDIRRGTRFSHTAVPGQQPLHSEAIDAAVLADVSGGKQLLRGNTLFGPERTVGLTLEVWQNAGVAVQVLGAAVTVRELAVPWHVTGSSPSPTS